MNKSSLRFPWCSKILILRQTVDCSHLHENAPVEERLAIKIFSLVLGSLTFWIMIEAFFA